MIEGIAGMIFFIIIIAICCASADGSSTNNTPPKSSSPSQRNVSYAPRSYSECPSCGAPYYDGYCDECGYPDINQGWLGEEYGEY